MKRRGQGRIILIGSEAALRGAREGSVYCASKFVLKGFAEAIRDETATSGIGVTLINPGMVMTPFFDDKMFRPGDQPTEHLIADDVAEAVRSALTAREGAVIDEINLSPQKKRIVKTKAIISRVNK